MTDDDIMRMAREADDGPSSSALHRFARLIAAAEREACAKVCDARAAEWYRRSARAQHHQGAATGASVCAQDIRRRGDS